MNAKKERELFLRSVERHLERENKILEGYRALSELLEDLPVGLLLDWVITEEEQHQSLLCTMINAFKQTARKERGDGADGVGMEQDKVLRWTERLRLYEHKFAADCVYLKSQACWEGAELFDAVLDAMIMDCRKREGLLLAVEEMVGQ